MKYTTSFTGKAELKLDNEINLLKKLGNPHENLKFIHVAGTNGKGSVCAFLETMLIKAGYKTGLFSSPELICKNESIRIDGENINDEVLDELLVKVQLVADSVEAETGGKPSAYEIMLGVAFLYYKSRQCDYVILEVGMGGEGDATNVIDNTKLCVITSISKDHTDFLGETENEIALVKAGIIKNNSMVVTTQSNISVMNIIKKKCDEKNCRLIVSEVPEPLEFEDIFEIRSGVKLSLGGVNQLENASVATECAKVLGVSDEDIIYGLENTKNPGRFEKLGENVYFDGAHNESGAIKLFESIKRYFGDEKISFVFGTMADKDYLKTIEILNRENSRFYFVPVKDNQRSESTKRILKRLDEKNIDINAMECNNIKEAISLAKGDGSKIIICGSLYMYKEIYENKLFG